MPKGPIDERMGADVHFPFVELRPLRLVGRKIQHPARRAKPLLLFAGADSRGGGQQRGGGGGFRRRGTRQNPGLAELRACGR